MDLNKILKIVLIVAIIVITGSIFYRYVIYLPKQQELKEQKEQQEKLTQETKAKEEKILSYKIKFQDDCGETYDKLNKDLESYSQSGFDTLFKVIQDNCNKNPNSSSFLISTLFYCINGQANIYGKDDFVPKCIDYKMKEINLTP